MRTIQSAKRKYYEYRYGVLIDVYLEVIYLEDSYLEVTYLGVTGSLQGLRYFIAFAGHSYNLGCPLDSRVIFLKSFRRPSAFSVLF